MIALISGKLVSMDRESAIVNVSGIGFEVLLPRTIADKLSEVEPGDEISLITSLHITTSGNKIVTILVGFTNRVERDFFEQLISVSGIGPKAAARSLTLPFSRVAQAIVNEDSTMLTTLPGIGKKRAGEIIHKLKDKVASAAMLSDDAKTLPPSPSDNIRHDAQAILEQLGYGAAEISRMIEEAGDLPQYDSAEELLAFIYSNIRNSG